MIEKIKKVSNPLTLIAIFSGLAEIFAIIVLSNLENELQKIFILFVIVFPTIVVILFFLTLNFNTKVLYAPSDFKSEENFIKVLVGLNKKNKEILVTPTNVNDYISNNRIKNKLGSSLKNNSNQKNTIDFANDLFKKLLSKIENKIKNNLINSVSYAMHSGNYFLLTIRFSHKLDQKRNKLYV